MHYIIHTRYCRASSTAIPPIGGKAELEQEHRIKCLSAGSWQHYSSPTPRPPPPPHGMDGWAAHLLAGARLGYLLVPSSQSPVTFLLHPAALAGTRGRSFFSLFQPQASFGSYHTHTHTPSSPKFQPVGPGLPPSFHTTSLLSTSDKNSALEKEERKKE